MEEDVALALTKSLAKELGEDRDKLKRLDDYYSGRHPLAFATKKFLEAFGGLFKASAVNWCPLVIAATLERLHVEGFRAGKDGREDAVVWDIWQANNLDADSNIGMREALKYGRAYVMVGAGEAEGDPPLITIESPVDVIHRNSTANRRRRAAALRVFTDDDGTSCATLYTPDQIFRWVRQKTATDDLQTAQWSPRVLPDREWPEANTLGVVPIVPLLAAPELDGWGTSELSAVLPLQDMVNKTVADMLVASEFVAMPQRHATGLDIERDPVTNQPIEPFPPTSRLWQAENETTQFGQFPNADLSNYVKVLETLKQDVATITRTPPHYFYLSGQFPSGEAIKSAEAGLVAKARDRMLTFGEGWEEVARLALRIQNGSDSAPVDMETIWGDPEYRIESEHVDATMKKQALGVPWRQLMEDIGYSPTQIERMQSDRDAEDRTRAANLVAAQAAMAAQEPNQPSNGDSPVAPGSAPANTDRLYAPPQ